MADLDDVPPLEDMSELLQHVENLKEYKAASKGEKTTKGVNKESLLLQPKASMPEKDLENKPKEKSQSESVSKPKQFGGMKKGFLFGGSSKKSPTKTPPASLEQRQTSSDDVPFIKPKETKEEQWKMPEVQQALGAGEAFLKNKDWITGDLMSKVQNNEDIIKRLADPRFMQAIAEFQTNPNGAMEKYKDNKEVQSFLQAFCGIMGEHFNSMADKEESVQNASNKPASIQVMDQDSRADLSVRSSTNPKQATAADEQRMQEILANPATQEILLDPRVQKLIETLRTDPDKAQRALQVADSDFKTKIQKLVEVGLLQFQKS